MQAGITNNWSNWRGPHYNGATEGKNLPVKFSPTEGVKWVAMLPGVSAATPIIHGDNVYTTAADFKNETLIAFCFDRKTGKERWRDAVGTGYRPAGQGNKVRVDERGHYASPSPVTDGKRVFFFFGNGDLAAFEPTGKKLWQRNIQKDYGNFAFQWTFSSSPLLFGGKLYLQILQRNQSVGGRGSADSESFLLALDPATGKELWKVVRPSEALMESREAYSTPMPYTYNGRTELLVVGGDCLTGHDPATGKELWRWGTWNENHRETWWRLVPSPVAGGGVVIACAPKRAPVYAAKLGGNGTLGAAGLVWRSADRSPVTSDVPTPLFYKNRFYILSDVRKALSCVEPQDGKVVWSVEIAPRTMCWGSPAGADGKLYIISLVGDVYVIDAASGKTLAENPMGEPGAEIRSSIAIAGNNLFVRTQERLYCIGK
jgi:outer membrane protein assembly factor BamB